MWESVFPSLDLEIDALRSDACARLLVTCGTQKKKPNGMATLLPTVRVFFLQKVFENIVIGLVQVSQSLPSTKRPLSWSLCTFFFPIAFQFFFLEQPPRSTEKQKLFPQNQQQRRKERKLWKKKKKKKKKKSRRALLGTKAKKKVMRNEKLARHPARLFPHQNFFFPSHASLRRALYHFRTVLLKGTLVDKSLDM